MAYRGLGEGFVLLFFGLVAVTGTVFVQSGQWDAVSLLLGAQVGFLSTALIAINNLRDHAEDSTTGKRTLAVRFGLAWARREVAFLMLAPFVIGLGWLFLREPGAALGPVVALPLAWRVARAVGRDDPGRVFNRHLARAGATMVLYALGFTAGVLLAGRT